MERDRVEDKRETVLVERILVIALALVMVIGATRYVLPLPMASIWITAIFVLYPLLCAYYIGTTKSSWHTLILVTFLIEILGSMFRLFHWPGAGAMMFVGSLNYLLVPFVLIFSAFKGYAKGSIRALYMLISILTAFPIFFWFTEERMGNAMAIFCFVLLLNLVLATKFIKQFRSNKEDARVLTLVGFQALLGLIANFGSLARAAEQEKNLIEMF